MRVYTRSERCYVFVTVLYTCAPSVDYEEYNTNPAPATGYFSAGDKIEKLRRMYPERFPGKYAGKYHEKHLEKHAGKYHERHPKNMPVNILKSIWIFSRKLC